MSHLQDQNHENIPLVALSTSEYTRLTAAVAANIKKIKIKTNEISEKLEKFDKNETPQFKKQLFDLQEKTSELCQNTKRNLLDIQTRSDVKDSGEQVQRQTRISRLTKEFDDVFKSFDSAQTKLVKKEKESLSRARLISQGDASLADKGTTQVHGDQTLAQQNWDLEQLQKREEAFRNLESNVMNVNQIFKDLGSMVEEQGAMIDSIEANVELTSGHIEKGKENLVKAVESNKSARKKKIVCGAVIAFVVILVIIIIIISFAVK